MTNIHEKIKKQITKNKIIIYIKGSPENPLCGFSAQVIQILNLLNIKYHYVNVLNDTDIRKELPIYSKWPTFPQLYHKSKLIGGADIILDLYKKNKLKTILNS